MTVLHKGSTEKKEAAVEKGQFLLFLSFFLSFFLYSGTTVQN